MTSRLSTRQKRAWIRAIWLPISSKWRRSISSQFSVLIPPLVLYDLYKRTHLSAGLSPSAQQTRIGTFGAKFKQHSSNVLSTEPKMPLVYGDHLKFKDKNTSRGLHFNVQAKIHHYRCFFIKVSGIISRPNSDVNVTKLI